MRYSLSWLWPRPAASRKAQRRNRTTATPHHRRRRWRDGPKARSCSMVWAPFIAGSRRDRGWPNDISTRACASSGPSTMTRRRGPLQRPRKIDPTLRELLLGRRAHAGSELQHADDELAARPGRLGAVRKAEANARRATPVERALIAAVAKRYRCTGEVDPSNSAPLLNAYVDAMRAGGRESTRTTSTCRRCTPRR